MADGGSVETVLDDDGVLRIELARPAAQNSLDPPMAEAFAASVARTAEPGVRAVLITAQGKNFCVGGDIRAFAAMGDGIRRGLQELAASLHDSIQVLTTQGAPVVSAVHGWCAGAGVGLPCFADVVVADEGTRFRAAYTAIGLSPDMGLTWLLPRLVGRARARDMVLTNRIVTADEALAWGLVSRVAPAGTAAQLALGIARDLAAGPLGTHTAIRQLLRDNESASLAEAMQAEARLIGSRAASAEGAVGIGAFLDGTTPDFRTV